MSVIIKAMATIVLMSLTTIIIADDTATPDTNADSDTTNSELSPFANWFESANYAFMFGGADIELSNPEGFDIGPDFFTNSFSETTGHYGIIAYHPSKFHPQLFTRTRLTYRAKADYEGLETDDIALSHGYQFNTPGTLKVAAGVSASASLGVIRARSFRDKSAHLAAGVEVSVFVRFYKVCIEAAAIAREADSSTLDELSVNPSYRGTVVSIIAGC